MVKKELFYKGIVVLQGNKLGHYFVSSDDSDDEDFDKICFSTNGKNRNEYAIGEQYNIDLHKDGRLNVNGKNGISIDDETRSKWVVSSRETLTSYEDDKLEKKFCKELENGFENMTLKDLKEKCQSNRMYRKMVLHYLMRGGLW